ncbi:MAG: hypothetical protein IT380_20400 [Myxococcales bacterium]|nr:hypothetical protein [Myxococcales bacterium]
MPDFAWAFVIEKVKLAEGLGLKNEGHALRGRRRLEFDAELGALAAWTIDLPARGRVPPCSPRRVQVVVGADGVGSVGPPGRPVRPSGGAGNQVSGS